MFSVRKRQSGKGEENKTKPGESISLLTKLIFDLWDAVNTGEGPTEHTAIDPIDGEENEEGKGITESTKVETKTTKVWRRDWGMRLEEELKVESKVESKAESKVESKESKAETKGSTTIESSLKKKKGK